MTYRQWLNVVKWYDAQQHYISAREEIEQSAAWISTGDREAYQMVIDALEGIDDRYYPKFIQRAYAYAKEVLNGND